MSLQSDTVCPINLVFVDSSSKQYFAELGIYINVSSNVLTSISFEIIKFFKFKKFKLKP